MKQSSVKMYILKMLLALYLLVIFVIVVVKFMGNTTELVERIEGIYALRHEGIWNIQLNPFDTTIIRYFSSISENFAWMNIAGTIIPFIPIGFLLFLIDKKLALMRCLGITLFFELCQFITLLGYFDIHDVLLNMLGSVIGYGLGCATLNLIVKIKGGVLCKKHVTKV